MEKLKELEEQEPYKDVVKKVNAIFSELREMNRERERIEADLAGKIAKITKLLVGHQKLAQVTKLAFPPGSFPFEPTSSYTELALSALIL